MKVAMIGLRGLGDGLGGVEKAVKEVSTRLVKQGVDVTCYCRPKYNTDSDYEGVSLVNTKTLYSKHGETAFYALGSMLKASKEDYDVIHIHAMASSLLAWIPKLMSKYNPKIVVTIHGLDWQRAKWGFIARNILKLAEKVALRYSNGIICVSLSLFGYFQMRYLNGTFHYVPNGCDSVGDKALAPLEDFAKDDYFLYLGRLVPEKGCDRLIQAFKALETTKKLVIAGPESHASDFNKKIHEMAKGDKRIHFTGPVYGEDKNRLMANAFLFILPSEIEGLPIAVLEACSYKTCPAVSSIPTAIEVLGNSQMARGFTFQARSVEQLKTVMETAEEAPEIVEALAEEAQKYVLANYNWDHVARETHNVYKSVLRGDHNG